MRRNPFWTAGLAFALAVGLLAAAPLSAQNPTGDLTGRVTDADGQVLAGVTVTATSPALQGTRVTTTGGNGDYKLALLPPGEYQVTYELEGFATATRQVRIPAAQAIRSDIEMSLTEVAEEIVVTGRMETISETPTGSFTVDAEEVSKLAVGRNLNEMIFLSPGVADTSPAGGSFSISGAMSFENLWMVNGVVINENVRGQILPLFIEDAIQETTTSVSGVTAEYGRFTGGVVNAITKSGGNEFSGSFRTSFTNDDWRARTPLSDPREDKTDETYEATLGGYLWKDHIWFFGAGRDFETAATAQTFVTNITYPTTDEEQRLEGKLTLSPHPSHSVIGSYLEIDRTRANSRFGTILDLQSLSNREDPQEIKAVNYTGILTPNFFVEAQYSERDFNIGKGSGGPQDQIFGTVMRRRGTAHRFWSATFCGACEDELRNNENLLGKASYFLTTAGAGTHDLVFGYDTFEDILFSINHQTGSDFTVWASDIIIDANNNIFPQFLGPSTWIGWFAVFNTDLARPTAFKTNSYYVNDRWQLNEKWSFNLGVRYDENDGENSAGAKVADDNKISPRLGMSYDVRGDGDLVINASYGTYVAAILNSGNIADSTSNGGAIGLFLTEYGGPLINTNPGCAAAGTCIPTDEALRILYDWYFSNGGTTSLDDDLSGIPNLISVSIPGQTAIVPETFLSPAADELTVGFTKRLGTKGLFRADVVYREWEDFYSNRVTLETGQVETSAGPVDVSEVGNFGDSVLKREYIGLHTNFRYRLSDRWTFAGNYTLSEVEGNINGETDVNGPIPQSPFAYPEYQEPRWAFPEGNLATDQRHRLRAWAIYDIFETDHHTLSASLLQNYFSGTPYGAQGVVDTRQEVGNIGYALVPSSFTYFFTDRDAFTTDDITRTDLALNYSFRWNAWGRSLEIFLQPEVINVLNEDGVIDVLTSVRSQAGSNTATACNGAPCQAFNPFTETPVEGVHWAKFAGFGEPENEDDFQQPRTFRFSVGFRF